MNIYRVLFVVGLLFLAGCNRSGDELVTTLGKRGGGEVLFDLKTPSRLVDKNGNSYVDKGHFSLLVQTKDKREHPIGDFGEGVIESALYENGSSQVSDEAKVKFVPSQRATTNKIALLLDFSGSLISDCDSVNSIVDSEKKRENLCYQLVESAKQFVDDTVNAQQEMAIYYFNSKTNITPLVTSNTASATSDKTALKVGLEQLYDKNFREQNLQGYTSTNLYGAVIEVTKVACQWVGSCNYDIYTPQKDTNLEHFEFASIVVFTDGKDLAHRVSESEMLNFIKRHDSLFYYTIGLGNVDKSVLEAIGKDKYIPVGKNSDLDGAFDDLSTQLKAWGNSFYKVEYCPAAQEGNVDIKIEVDDGRYHGVINDHIKMPENVDFRCDI
jgi:hypothetical protein